MEIRPIFLSLLEVLLGPQFQVSETVLPEYKLGGSALKSGSHGCNHAIAWLERPPQLVDIYRKRYWKLENTLGL